MTHQFFYRILAEHNIRNAQERRFQPFPQQSAAHGSMSLVKDIEKCSFPAAIAYILGNFQMADARRINDQTPFIIDAFQMIDMRDIGLHDLTDVG